MKTHTITVRGVPEPVLRTLRSAGESNRRSLNGEVLSILERATARRHGSAEPGGGAAAPSRVTAVPRSPLPDRVDRGLLASVCRRHHIRWLAVFGSQATGTARPDSDIDVVVDFEPGMTPGLGIEAVAEALAPVLGGRRVDLLTRRGLSRRLREQILAAAVPLHGA